MKLFAKRRLLMGTILAALAVLIIGWDYANRLGMQQTSIITGWVLSGLIVFLAGYQLRKKLSLLPLGRTNLWLQCHIYTGLLTSIVFLVHVGYHLPNGPFEILLTVVYALVFVSGFIGLLLSRTLAARLALQEEHILFDRIPRYIKLLQSDVQNLVLECIRKTESTLIPDFYQSHLANFFSGPKHFWRHLIMPSQAKRQLAWELNAQKRYLSDFEQETMQQISECVELKHTLDAHYANQALLKYWLFLHVPLTYVLIVFTLAHIWLVYRYSGVVS